MNQLNKNNNKATEEGSETNKQSAKSKWMKRLGVGAFAFFLIKGIVWLFVFFAAFQACG
ncbi:MAG: alanyl-tRNA synthetase [Bacteroidetes bacterium]|jgi:hypothetical protein|nr:alanyl-tRNA synthetase [Bacteroidota bacterium]